jgi:hypothetical protein
VDAGRNTKKENKMNPNTNITQSTVILAHLKKKPITPLEALNLYGCFRLGARIWELKANGHDIKSEMVKDKHTGKRYASYSLKGVKK